MTESWVVVVLLLVAGIGWSYYRQRRLEADLRRVRRHDLDLKAELAESKTALAEVRSRSQRLLAASTQALIIVEKDHRVSSANTVARQMFGHFEKNISFIEWTRHHELLELVDQALGNQKMPPLLLSLQNKTVEAQAGSIREGDQVTAVALALNDVTELHRLSRARRDFVANISHELRTPLTSLQLLLETLHNANVLDDQTMRLELLDKVTAQVETLGQLAQELLDLSLIESGQLPLKLAVYPLHEMVYEEITKLLPQAQRKNISLDLTIDSNLKVLADKRMVGRALANLIHNAIKFTDQGGVTVSAEISDDTVALAPGGDGEPWVTVSVRDSGVGLPPAEISRIFERFYKIDRSRKQSGTGLGLAIAKHIVEGHGGRIWAHNNPKAGVTFSFSLPGEG